MSGAKDPHRRPESFVCLHEFYARAKDRLPREIWDYLMGGAETETTLHRNRQALDSLAFRPRVLRDVSRTNTRGRLLGLDLKLPIVLAPIGGLQDLDPGGAASSAKAASAFGIVGMHSSVSEPALEVIAAAAPGPQIFQLYIREGKKWLAEHAERAIKAGFHAFCLTVDLAVYARRERDLAKGYVTTTRRRNANVVGNSQAKLCWRDIERFKKTFNIPLIVKGIATGEDAAIAVDCGVDVVYVSNHGGRQLDHGRATISVLPEVVAAVNGQAEIIVDGGFLRGSDVAKAMALGANAVGVGRLMGLALSAGGQEGLVAALEILEHEFLTTLALLGVESASELNSDYLHTVDPVYRPGYGSAFPLLDEGY